MPLFAVWNRKIDLIEGQRVSVICNDGRVAEYMRGSELFRA